jgi:hypothetical protein
VLQWPREGRAAAAVQMAAFEQEALAARPQPPTAAPETKPDGASPTAASATPTHTGRSQHCPQKSLHSLFQLMCLTTVHVVMHTDAVPGRLCLLASKGGGQSTRTAYVCNT